MMDELEHIERCLRIYRGRLSDERPKSTASWVFEEWKSAQRLYREKIKKLEKRKEELENAIN